MRLHRTAALVCALVVAGCNNGQDPTVEAGDTTRPSTGATGAATAPSTAPPATVAPAAPPVSAPAPAGTGRAYLTGVRVAAAADGGGGSRVVFEFDPSVPGYEIDYVQRPVTEDGSGDEVTVAGAAVLQVRMADAAGARLDGEKVVRTYTGPKRVVATGSGGVVTEAVDVGDFEGQVTWAVGLRQKVPAFTVTTLSGPSRLVIDVPAPQK